MKKQEESMKRAKTAQEERMENGKLIPLMLSLGIPTFIAQLINLLYNIVDRIYIGHISDCGTSALTGVGLCLPIITLVSAFANLVGAGGAPLAAISLGKGEREQAEKILGNGAALLLFFSIGLMVVFYLAKKPFLYLFGASDVTYSYANDYICIYLIGTIFVLYAMGLNLFITAQGQSKVAMISILLGAVSNIILDPILIFVLNLGIKGAAIATVVSQGISAGFVVCFLHSKKSGIRLRLKNMRLDGTIVGKILSLGISPFIMATTESLITISYNSSMQRYGNDMYVGSITIMQSVLQIIFAPIQGFSQGVSPIVSYNYGAKKYDRCKKTCRTLITMTFLTGMFMSLFAIIFPNVLTGLFTEDKDMIALCSRNLPIFVAGMTIFGIQSGAQQCFMALGQVKQSLFFALFRKVILLIPLVLVLPVITGQVTSIYYAEPISDGLSAICCFIVFLFTMKKLFVEKSS